MSVSAVFQVIWHNLWGYDLFIILVGVVNIALYCYTRYLANALYSMLHRMIFIPSRRLEPERLTAELSSVDEERAVALRKRSAAFYAVFSNLTAIFPLLGILGTVLSLLPMVSDLSDMQTNFFAALTSTFWGLIFAILCKFLDGFLSARMEDNDRSVALLLERQLETEGVPV